MYNNDTSATNDSIYVGAYFESLIMNAVAQADAPLHEALVRSNVYRTINEAYERALAQLVIDGELLYANGEYRMAPDVAVEAVEPVREPEAADTVKPEAVESEVIEDEDIEPKTAESEDVEGETVEDEDDGLEAVESEAVEDEGDEPEVAEIKDVDSAEIENAEFQDDEVMADGDVAIDDDSAELEVLGSASAEVVVVEPVAPETPAAKAVGPISLRADSTLEQLKVNERSWPIPVAVGVSYDKKPADGLALMGYEPPAEPVAAEPVAAEPAAATEQQESVQPARPELTLSSEPQQLAISFSDGLEVEQAVAEPEAAAEPEPEVAAEPEQPALAFESEPVSVEELAPEPEADAEAAPTPESKPDDAPAAEFNPFSLPVNKPERPDCLSGWDDPRCVFDSETQVAFLDKQKIHDVFCLVRELGKAKDANVRAAFERRLLTYAMPLSPQYRAQAPELGKLSGNAKFVFDVFGNLRKVGRECCAYMDVKGPATESLGSVYSGDGEPLSLWNLSITATIQRKLKWNCQIHNMPELLACSWKVLQEKGLTSAEVRSIVSALNDWPAGRLLLGRTKTELELARQAAIGGWYPPVNTPVERAKRVNDLADEAILQLRREHLSAHGPSFRLLFCIRLAGKLAAGYSDKYSVGSVLTELKNEFPAYNAAIKTFKRLNFELPQDQEDIEASNLESTCENGNSTDSVIASVDEVKPDDQLDTQTEAPGAQAAREPEQPAAQDLTVEQALKLAVGRDLAKFNRWFTDLVYQDRTLMGYMLIDDKPARWMDNLGKSAWKIRERYDALMTGRPTFDIDTFGPLFHTYKLSAEEFYGLTHTAQPAFLYMKRVYGQGTIPLKYAQVDKDLAPAVCDVVRAYLAGMAAEYADDQVEEKPAPVEQAFSPAIESAAEPEPAVTPEPASEPVLAAEPDQAVASAPEPEPEPTSDPEPAPEPEPTPGPVTAPAPEPAPAPAPQQPAKPFTSKIEDLTSKGPMSIEAWLALLPSDDADLMRWVISDKPLMDYPHKPAGLGPLRQRRAALLKNRPHLNEDQFAPLYMRYDITEEAFCKITLADPMAFGYLKAVKISNKFSLRLAANDGTLPREWRDRIARLYRRSAADAPRTPANTEESNASQLEQIARKKLSNFSTRGAALSAFAESGAVKEYHNLKDFRNRYQQFLGENKCGFRLTLALPDDDVKCLNELRDTHMFLVARANKIRAYKVDSRLTSGLREILTLAAGRNIECGTGLIMRENKELCDLYDIRDDEELYEIIRSFVRPGSVSGLEMGVTPLIRLGKTDRKNQMLGVLRDAGTELSREEFAQRYADKYCIAIKTVRNNYLRDMNAYLRNGRYSYVDSDLTAEQRQFIQDLVTEDYVSLPYVTASFAAKFGPTSDRLVNDQTLAPLGLEISRDLIVKEGVDLRRSFTNLLMSHDSFAYGAPGFGDEVINHPEFRNAITPLLRNFTFIECNRDSFISLKRLGESAGVRRLDLGSYACSLFSRTEPDVPFTVMSLRKQGFMHKLDAVVDECGFDNSFYDSIVLYGLANEHIRRTRFGGVCMFCRKEGSFSSADAVEYVVRQKGPIEVGDLIDAFMDDYGVVITAPDISRAVQDKGLFYNEDLNMVMLNKRVNAEYLRSLYVNINQ